MGVHESIAAFERHLLFDEAGRFAGWCDENLALPDGWAMAEIPDGFTEADAGEWCFADGHVMRGADAAPDERQRQAVIELMRAQAQQRIEALAWRIERATERSTIGVAGETPSDVLAEREALRVSSC